MTNEEKILELLGQMKSDLSVLKSDVAELKERNELKAEVRMLYKQVLLQSQEIEALQAAQQKRAERSISQ